MSNRKIDLAKVTYTTPKGRTLTKVIPQIIDVERGKITGTIGWVVAYNWDGSQKWGIRNDRRLGIRYVADEAAARAELHRILDGVEV